MGVDAAVPSGIYERIRSMVQEEVGKLLRSGLLRNASISEGGLTIKGGFLRMLASVTGTPVFFVGPYGPEGPDGTPQQGFFLRRADGSLALDMQDQFPGDDGGLFNQAVNWWDRTGHAVFADDTNSGQGIARPWLQHAFYPARFGDWLLVNPDEYETVWRAEIPHQQPRLSVAVQASSTSSTTTGGIRVLVNGVELAPEQSVGFALTTLLFGPAPVSGSHMQLLTVEIQARQARVAPLHIMGRQT